MSYFSITPSTDGQDDIDFFSYSASAQSELAIAINTVISGYTVDLIYEASSASLVSTFPITFTNNIDVDFYTYSASLSDSYAIPIVSLFTGDYTVSLAYEATSAASVSAFPITFTNNIDVDFYTYSVSASDSYAIPIVSLFTGDYTVDLAYETTSAASVTAFPITFTNNIDVDFYTYSVSLTDSYAIPINSLFAEGYTVDLAYEVDAASSVTAFPITFTNNIDVDFYTYTVSLTDSYAIPVSLFYGFSADGEGSGGTGGTGTGRKQIWSQY